MLASSSTSAGELGPPTRGLSWQQVWPWPKESCKFRVLEVFGLKGLKPDSSTKIFRNSDTKRKGKISSREECARSHDHHSPLWFGTYSSWRSLVPHSFGKAELTPEPQKKASDAFKVKSDIIRNQLSEPQVYGRIHWSRYQTFCTALEQKTQRLIRCCPCPQLVFNRPSPEKMFCMFLVFCK